MIKKFRMTYLTYVQVSLQGSFAENKYERPTDTKSFGSNET